MAIHVQIVDTRIIRFGSLPDGLRIMRLMVNAVSMPGNDTMFVQCRYKKPAKHSVANLITIGGS